MSPLMPRGDASGWTSTFLPSFHLVLEVTDYMKGWAEQLSLVPAALGLNPLYWEFVLSPCVLPWGPPWDLLSPEPA